jgi:hypothetical protein
MNEPMSVRRFPARLASIVLAATGLSACATWRPVASFERWSLFAERGQAADASVYASAVEPALAAVELELGPFRRSVNVHAWSGNAGAETSGADVIHEGEGGPVEDVPGIGPARVRAYHARGQGLFGPPAGIFLAAPECGTVAHELVHARTAEDDLDLPLWLEEGVACLLGDGFLDGKRWIVDGLSCWPLRELQAQRITDADLAHLLTLHAGDSASPRENVLAHFVGWAIVFDLYREAGRVEWTSWCARYGHGISESEARTRLERTVAAGTALAWIERLKDRRSEVRLATAKGLWKLRSEEVTTKLLDALEQEEDPEVKVGFAINLLACAGEIRLPESMTGRVWRTVWPTLRRASLPDPEEQSGIDQLLRSFRSRSGRSAQEPLQKLRRYWAE